MYRLFSLFCILTLFFSVSALGDTATFTTYQNDIPGPVLIPGHHLSAGQQDVAVTWNYSGNYGDPRLPTYILPWNNNNQVTICTNGLCGSNNFGFGQQYTGYEFVYFTFQLPANATNLNLHLSYVSIDDRAIVDFNGHVLGGWGGNYQVAPGTTQQQLDGTGYHTVTFNGPPTAGSLDFNNQAWFSPGGENYLRFWINNTNSGIIGNAYPHFGDGDPSALQTCGYVTYELGGGEVPEPTSLVLMATGLIGLSRGLRKLLG